MKNFKSIVGLFLVIILVSFAAKKSLYDYSITTLEGKEVKLESFKGKKILIVNTASKCGYTSQYEGLQKLYDKYNGQLEIIGFPANNFMNQEPGSNDEIASFCQKNYGVSFTMSEKVSVKGKDMADLFKFLTEQPNPDFKGDIKWNFEKFLIDENGKLIHRYRSSVKPMSEELTKAIEAK